MLFHGTDATLNPGDILTLNSRGLAYATPHLYTARVFGPNIYEVEPVQPGEPWQADMAHTNGEPHIEVISLVGYRVVGPAPALPVDPHSECVLCYLGLEDPADHDATHFQIVGFHEFGAVPTSEPCPGEQDCVDCQESRADCA